MSGWHLLLQCKGAKLKLIAPFCVGNKIQIPRLGIQSCAAKFLISSGYTIGSRPVVFKLFGLRTPLTLLNITEDTKELLFLECYLSTLTILPIFFVVEIKTKKFNTQAHSPLAIRLINFITHHVASRKLH